jgi:predicted ATPase
MASITDARDFMPALSVALDVREAEGRSPGARVASLIGDQRVLLLLDNLEQVVSAAPEIAELITKCPGLKLLVTSRAPLRISHEREYPLAPLKLPDPDESMSVESMRDAPAVALFVECARKAKPGFDMTPDNAADVVAVCRRLDGLPLALELAGARIRLLSPKVCWGGLIGPDFSARGSAGATSTLRATIDEPLLLTETEKRSSGECPCSGAITIDGRSDIYRRLPGHR